MLFAIKEERAESALPRGMVLRDRIAAPAMAAPVLGLGVGAACHGRALADLFSLLRRDFRSRDDAHNPRV